MKKHHLIGLFTVIVLTVFIHIPYRAQTFDWRHLARGADTAEIYITCHWYDINMHRWGAIFRSTDNGASLSVQRKYVWPTGCREIFGDSTQGVLYQYPSEGGLGVSYDYGMTFEGKYTPIISYPTGIGGCRKGEFYVEGMISDTVKALYHITNFGDSLNQVNTHFDSLTIREPGSLEGEVYAIEYPYYGSQSDTLGLAFSSDYGQTFTVNYLDTSIVAYMGHHTLSSGPAPGELYMSAWYMSQIRIFHSFDYGHTFELKYSFPFDPTWYEYSFVAGRLPGTFYIFEEGLCSTVPLHNCITIYFSRDYGATYTAYFHELDSTYTGTGIKEFRQDLEVYPNPAADMVTFRFGGTLPDEDTRIMICDIFGEKAADGVLPKGKTEVTMDIRTLAPGLYCYVIIRNQKRQTGKLVIAK